MGNEFIRTSYRHERALVQVDTDHVSGVPSYQAPSVV